MGSWTEIMREIQGNKNQCDSVRGVYLRKFADLTGRNVIAYYSSWVNKQNIDNPEITICDNDVNGFMNALHNVDCSKGLDLVLHTPGGDIAATEAIVKYLRVKFGNNIRAFIPQIAMSAGTMIACAAKEIFMGKQSSLGPIDPQFNGIPAYNIKAEFEEAKDDLQKHPENAQYWAIKLQQYPAAFMKSAIDAIALSETLLREWLGSCMFDSNRDSEIISKIVTSLNEHTNSKIHNRHLNSDFCKSAGLKISMLEDNPKMQDVVLSLHHAYMITFDTSSAIKIIENDNGKSRIIALGR